MKFSVRNVFCLFMIALLLCSLEGTASADSTITLATKALAKALVKATLRDAEGYAISADMNEEEVSFQDKDGNDIDVSAVALIDFAEGDESEALDDYEISRFIKRDIDKFTGLKSLSLNNCTDLTTLDLSGNETIEILDISNLAKLTTLTANNMPKLKAVGIARVNLESSSSLADMLGGMGGSGNSESTPAIATLASEVLANLTEIDLSNNPKLSSVGYVLTKEEEGDMFSGFGTGGSSSMGNGSNSSDDNAPPKVTKYGYKARTVFTALVQNTKFLRADKSYSEEPAGDDSNNFLSGFMTGSNGNVLGNYTGETVNLLPALKIFTITDNGTDVSSYISEIDVSNLTVMETADFSEIKKLKKISLPAGEKLTSLDLTNDTALEDLDLSYTKGFVWPAGFSSLTGLKNFRMYGRDIDSIDVRPFTQLVSLNVTSNKLTSLDVTKNPELVTLYISNNSVRELDLSSQTKLQNIDAKNNSLVKIDLSRNINMLVHESDLDAPVRLSKQKRDMSADGIELSKKFDFKAIYPNMPPTERANIMWDSIAGNGQKTTSVDVDLGTVEFAYYPTVITYDYKSGVIYSNSSKPVCMTVDLSWEGVTDEELEELRAGTSDDKEPVYTNTSLGGSSGGCEAGVGMFGAMTLVIFALVFSKKH